MQATTHPARTAPDQAALAAAHRLLRTLTPLDELLKDPTLRVVVETLARRQMKRRAAVDFKKLQANDIEVTNDE